jgi:hypothetical protein
VQHVAQFNIARGRAPLDDPEMSGFVARLAEINALADASAGFVWRLQDGAGDATSIRAYADPRIIVNLSVWESIDVLFEFAYKSRHVDVYRGRAQWFERLDTPSIALWWIPAGDLPSVGDGVARLEHLAAHVPTPHAFTLRHRFAAEAATRDPVRHLTSMNPGSIQPA